MLFASYAITEVFTSEKKPLWVETFVTGDMKEDTLSKLVYINVLTYAYDRHKLETKVNMRREVAEKVHNTLHVNEELAKKLERHIVDAFVQNYFDTVSISACVSTEKMPEECAQVIRTALANVQTQLKPFVAETTAMENVLAVGNVADILNVQETTALNISDPNLYITKGNSLYRYRFPQDNISYKSRIFFWFIFIFIVLQGAVYLIYVAEAILRDLFDLYKYYLYK